MEKSPKSDAQPPVVAAFGGSRHERLAKPGQNRFVFHEGCWHGRCASLPGR